MKWIVLALALLMYALVLAFQDKKVFWSLGAAAIAITLGTLFPSAVFEGSGRAFAICHSFFDLINWNVLMIYIGSMTIAALFITPTTEMPESMKPRNMLPVSPMKIFAGLKL